MKKFFSRVGLVLVGAGVFIIGLLIGTRKKPIDEIADKKNSEYLEEKKKYEATKKQNEQSTLDHASNIDRIKSIIGG